LKLVRHLMLAVHVELGSRFFDELGAVVVR
jgi:hypothetical protein